MKSRTGTIIPILGAVLILIAAGILLVRVLGRSAQPAGSPGEQAADQPTEPPQVEIITGVEVATLTPSPALTQVSAEGYTYTGLQTDLFTTYQASIQVEAQEASGSGEWWLTMWTTLTVQDDPPAGQFTLGGATQDKPSRNEIVTYLNDLVYFYVGPEGNTDTETECFETPGFEDWLWQLDIAPFLDRPGGVLDPANFPDPLPLAEKGTALPGSTVPADHYRMEGLTAGTLQEATVDMWIDPQRHYPLKIELSGMAQLMDKGVYIPAMVWMAYDLVSVNTPVEIALPEVCRMPGDS